MAALVKSNRDLASGPNIVQARYELNRAIDRDDPNAQAEWAREWGAAALICADDASDRGEAWDFFGPPDSLLQDAEDAKNTYDSLRAIMAAETPDMALARTRLAALGRLLVKINAKLDIEE